MKPEDVIKCLQQIRKWAFDFDKREDGLSYVEAIDEAIVETRKRIPLRPIEKKWNPNLCPTCAADLGGECYDGYYQNPRLDFCPYCRQKLDYE